MSTAKGMTPGPMALLPPIYLYRRLLRAHRKYLPAEMRLLGDEYVKAEFRAHRDVENPVHLVSYTVMNTLELRWRDAEMERREAPVDGEGEMIRWKAWRQPLQWLTNDVLHR
jgi:hypothetical protein